MAIYKKLGNDIVKVAGNNFSDSIPSNIAEEYVNDKIYSKGSYCLYNGELFKCVAQISTTGEWDSSCWEKTLVGDNLQNLNGMSSTVTKIMNVFRGMSTASIPMFQINNVLSFYEDTYFQVYQALGQIFISAEVTTNYELEPSDNNDEYDFNGPLIGFNTNSQPLSNTIYIHAVPISSTGKLTAFIRTNLLYIKVLEPIPAFTKIHLSGSYVTNDIYA